MRKSIVSLILAIIFCAAPASGIVLHPGHEPALDWSDRPADPIIGRWSHNGSFVAIAPNWIVTTRHQGTQPSSVTIEGADYDTHYSNAWTGGPEASESAAGELDLQLVRLTAPDGGKANLPHYADIFTGNFFANMRMRLGGYGRGRGEELQAQGSGGNPITYGYEWGTRTNAELRWATNLANKIITRDVDGTSTRLVIADFDDPDGGLSTEYEGTPAEYDSGSGWFVQQDGQWRLLGLTRGVEVHGSPWPAEGESWFRSRTAPDTLASDEVEAIHVADRDLRNWIDSIILPGGDANGDGRVTDADYTIWADNYGATDAIWEMGDWNQDGSVTDADYTIWADNYDGSIPAGELALVLPPGGVPEPFSALMLIALTPLIRRRRRVH